MNCLELREILSLYADGVLNEAENAACEKHLAECALCRQELDNIIQISHLFQELPEEPLPEEFQTQLHQRLLKEIHPEFSQNNVTPIPTPKKQKKTSRRWLGGVLAASLLLAIGIGAVAANLDFEQPGLQTASQDDSNTFAREEAAVPRAAAPAEAADHNSAMPLQEDASADYGLASGEANQGSASAVTQQEGRKIIYNTYLSLDVDQVEPKIQEATSIADKYQGYVLSSSVSQDEEGQEQWGAITIRIPIAQYDAAVEEFITLGTLRENYTNGNDVTYEYYDVQARLKQYKAQEQRYMELLEQATTVSEIMEVEAQLNEVRLQIESLEANLNTLTRLTDYGTIDINFSVSNVKTEGVSFGSWKGLGGRLGQALTASVNAIIYGLSRCLVFLVYILPILLVVVLLVLVLVLLLRHKKKKKKD